MPRQLSHGVIRTIPRASWTRTYKYAFNRKKDIRRSRRRLDDYLLAGEKSFLRIAKLSKIYRSLKDHTIRIPDGEYWAFLGENRGQLAEIMHKAAKQGNLRVNGFFSEVNAVEKFREALENNGSLKCHPELLLKKVASFAAAHFLNRPETFAHFKAFLRNELRDYLTYDRAIVTKDERGREYFDEATYNEVFEVFFEKMIKRMVIEGKAVPLSQIEPLFIDQMKVHRARKIFLGDLANSALRKSLAGRAIRKEYYARLKQKIIRKGEDLFKSLLPKLVHKVVENRVENQTKNGLSEEEVMKLIYANVDEIYEKPIDDFARQMAIFVQHEAKKFPLREKKEEMIAKDSKPAKEAVQRQTETKQAAALQEQLRTMTAVTFDRGRIFEEAMASIRAANPRRAQLLRDLVSEGHLKRHTFELLHSKSHLGEKLFFQTMFDRAFLDRFGQGGAEPVARIFAYLSGLGHHRERVRRNLQGASYRVRGPNGKTTVINGSDLFQFLESHDYLAKHTGGEVDYLQRHHK